MDESEVPCYDALELDEIAEILEELGEDLPPETLREAAIFVKQMGSIESALAAIAAADLRNTT